MIPLLSIILLLAIVSANYAPQKVGCPAGRLIREAKGLSKQEADWVANKKTTEHLKLFLETSNLTDFDANAFLTDTDHNIKIGLAFSGGGFRAMLCGAGFMSALDNRTRGAHEHGLGGLLQASTYMSGLSGGSWLVGSVVSNNFTSVQDIMDNKTKIWDLTYSILDAKGSGIFNIVKYYLQLIADVLLKKMAGFQTTLTDLWGRALSHHFFGGTNYGDDLFWSGVQNMTAFINHDMPYPIVIANAVDPGNKKVNNDSAIVEITPFEIGSWDPALNSFMETKYMGSNVTNGMPTEESCVNGYDNAGFLLGASSTLFNEVFGNSVTGRINETAFNSTVGKELDSALSSASDVDHFVAVVKPNPFRNAQEGGNKNITGDDILSLVDGGEDSENVPLYPLVQEAREVDVVFAYDSSADTAVDWPNGNAMYQAYERQFTEQGKTMSVPKIPTKEVFLLGGLTSKPVFFGCDANAPSEINNGNNATGANGNLTLANSTLNNLGKKVPPLIVYTANRKLSFDSNKSTFTFVYTEAEKAGMVRNGFEVATRNNGTEDSAWKTCVSCAIIRREQERRNMEQSDQCKQCFEKYCWRG